DWLLEDGSVSIQVPWPTGNPPPGSNRQISHGTFRGLSFLRTLRPGPHQPGAGSLLSDSLAAGLNGSPMITLTGHSLGGALAPALALFLSDTQGTWDPAMRTKIACLASTGPTPGNRDFADYFNSQLGPVTTRFWNTLDVVPHVWNADGVVAIP